VATSRQAAGWNLDIYLAPSLNTEH
jgi:hypothetical protein